MALGSELDLTELNEKVLADGKKLVLPVVKGKDLIFREVKGLTEEYFGIGSFGIREPKEELPLWDPVCSPGSSAGKSCREAFFPL